MISVYISDIWILLLLIYPTLIHAFADVLQGARPLSARHPSSIPVATHRPHTPSTTVMEWFREGGVLLGALREHGGVKGHGVRHPHSSLTRIRLKQSDRR